MSVHQQVLNSLNGERVQIDQKANRFQVEQPGWRLDLPREDLTSTEKEPGQRKRNLIYPDCVLLAENDKPRMIIQVVDNSPQDPSGIVGLVINVDRLAVAYYPGVELLFVVLGQMKEFWCPRCATWHDILGPSSHFNEAWEAVKNISPLDILHEGVAMNYRKALLDYPIVPYLMAIRAPLVLFLNSEKIENDWQAYQAKALNLIKTHVSQRVREADRNPTWAEPAAPVFVGVEELFPELRADAVATA